MKYSAKLIDGEWSVVDQDGNFAEAAVDRKDAILTAASMNRAELSNTTPPNVTNVRDRRFDKEPVEEATVADAPPTLKQNATRSAKFNASKAEIESAPSAKAKVVAVLKAAGDDRSFPTSVVGKDSALDAIYELASDVMNIDNTESEIMPADKMYNDLVNLVADYVAAEVKDTGDLNNVAQNIVHTCLWGSGWQGIDEAAETKSYILDLLFDDVYTSDASRSEEEERAYFTELAKKHNIDLTINVGQGGGGSDECDFAGSPDDIKALFKEYFPAEFADEMINDISDQFEESVVTEANDSITYTTSTEGITPEMANEGQIIPIEIDPMQLQDKLGLDAKYLGDKDKYGPNFVINGSDGSKHVAYTRDGVLRIRPVGMSTPEEASEALKSYLEGSAMEEAKEVEVPEVTVEDAKALIASVAEQLSTLTADLEGEQAEAFAAIVQQLNSFGQPVEDEVADEETPAEEELPITEGDMTKDYVGFKLLNMKTNTLSPMFKYVKGTNSTEVENQAKAKMAKETGLIAKAFAVHELVKHDAVNESTDLFSAIKSVYLKG